MSNEKLEKQKAKILSLIEPLDAQEAEAVFRDVKSAVTEKLLEAQQKYEALSNELQSKIDNLK